METEAIVFKKNRGSLLAMLKMDFRRMFTQRLLYIMLGCCLAMPIMTLVMTTAVDGGNSGGMMFDNVWQIIGSVSGGSAVMAMDMTSMCNINLVYFGAAVFTALYISAEFKSGYAKNLFSAQAKKSSYIISKILVCAAACVLMLIMFFVGAMSGGAFSGISFELGDVTVGNIILCMLSKIFLMFVFLSIYIVVSIFARQKTWLGIVLGGFVGMLLFMMIPALTPLNAGIGNVLGCFIAAAAVSLVLGAVGKVLLQRIDLV